MKQLRLVAIGVALAIGVPFAALQAVHASTRAVTYEAILPALPPQLRLRFFNEVFTQPTEDCWGCYGRLVGGLHVLEKAILAHDEVKGFDYAQLLVLINRSGRFREPIPVTACRVLLVRRDERVYRAMAQAYQADADSLESCFASGMSLLKAHFPLEYEPTRIALLKVPELTGYVAMAR